MNDYDLMIICNLCQTEECLIKVENIAWSSNLRASIRLEERKCNDDKFNIVCFMDVY
jgi:hypothetical protein